MELLPQTGAVAFLCGFLLAEAILYGALIWSRRRGESGPANAPVKPPESPLAVLTSMVVDPASVAQVQRDNNRFFPAEAVARLCSMVGGGLEATGRRAERQLGILSEKHPGKVVLLEVVRRY